MSANFGEKLTKYVALVQKLHDEKFARDYKNLTAPLIDISVGKKYVKLVRIDDGGEGSSSVHSFVSAVDNPKKGEKVGDILKPATYSAPAKHPRGSIFVDNGRGALTESGFVKYLG